MKIRTLNHKKMWKTFSCFGGTFTFFAVGIENFHFSTEAILFSDTVRHKVNYEDVKWEKVAPLKTVSTYTPILLDFRFRVLHTAETEKRAFDNRAITEPYKSFFFFRAFIGTWFHSTDWAFQVLCSFHDSVIFWS